jgi:hypothetical protein
MSLQLLNVFFKSIKEQYDPNLCSGYALLPQAYRPSRGEIPCFFESWSYITKFTKAGISILYWAGLIVICTELWKGLFLKLKKYTFLIPSLNNEFSGNRSRRLHATNTKSRHWTRFWASSIHFKSSQPISIRSTLILSSQLIQVPVFHLSRQLSACIHLPYRSYVFNLL